MKNFILLIVLLTVLSLSACQFGGNYETEHNNNSVTPSVSLTVPSSLISVPSETAPTEPIPTEPIPTEPIPTEPIPTEPIPTEPIPTEPIPTEPISTEPAPTEPAPTELPSTPEEEWPDLDGNPYTTHEIIDGEIIVYYDYSEAYEKLDLSQYTNWGYFGVDGIMWVEKTDYTGKRLGYIDYEGNEIIPLTNEIKRAYDFDNGLAIIAFSEDIFKNGSRGIINTEGTVVGTYENHSVTKLNQLNNGNIVFDGINMAGEEYPNITTYMFVKATCKFVEIPTPAWGSIETLYYSDGYLLVYSNYYVDPGAKYFDELGNCVLNLDKSCEYYARVVYASAFSNGKATVNFIGLDGNWYTVQIDKKGTWVTDPIAISEYYADTFENSL